MWCAPPPVVASQGSATAASIRGACRNHDGVMSTSALLVMDVQNAIVDRIAGDGAPLLAAVNTAAAAARSAGAPVIYVRVGFRPHAPEISPRNRAFAAARVASMGLDDAATQ